MDDFTKEDIEKRYGKYKNSDHVEVKYPTALLILIGMVMLAICLGIVLALGA